jgi:hypothetical protein
MTSVLEEDKGAEDKELKLLGWSNDGREGGGGGILSPNLFLFLNVVLGKDGVVGEESGDDDDKARGDKFKDDEENVDGVWS